MKNEKEHIKILTTLSLASSDTRKDTLTSIVFSTLFQTSASKEDILRLIRQHFDFEPYRSELFSLVDGLIAEGRINMDSTGKCSLPLEEEVQLKKLDIQLQDNDKHRFQNFKNFLVDELGAKVDTAQVKLIWGVFVEYLYNNFFEFGEDAFKRFHPHMEYKGESNNDIDFFNLASKKLNNKELFALFRQAVEKFPEFASAEDLNFLVDLAQKTICFTSLGIDPKLADTDPDQSLIDWTLYLDTNVLYSILGLHSHPENEACKALVELVSDNQDHLKISLRFSEKTQKELMAIREDFKLIDENLSRSAIKALLKSDDIDDFTKKYFSDLLTDPDSTIHPSKVLELGPQTLLRKYKIDIARNQKRIEQIGEEYINYRIQDYRRFIEDKNAIREEYNKNSGNKVRQISKSDKQITHDITLRELLLHLRAKKLKEGEEATLKSVKFFGLTIDSLLLEFDKRQTKDYNDEQSFPVFFRPSYLLSKLVRILPIKTSDYKMAFIKAVTTRGFNKDPQKSQDILRLVNYLKKQGIDDERVVYNLISKDIFLETFSRNRNDPEFSTDKFIESELNREFKIRQEELERTKEDLVRKEGDLLVKTAVNLELKNEAAILIEKKTVLEHDVLVYDKAIRKLQGQVRKLEADFEKPNSQSELNFEAGKSKAEAERFKQKLKKELESKVRQYKVDQLKKWQKGVWWHLLWAIPVFFGSIAVVFSKFLETAMPNDSSAIRIVTGSIALIIDGVFIKMALHRYDEGAKQKRMENTEAPADLQRELDELVD